MVLEPVVEFVVGFLIKQAARHGPRMLRDVWQRLGFPRLHRASVPRVKLVNRQRELRAIRAALADAPHLRILYLCGPGGVGKTRLLEETERLSGKMWVDTPLRWVSVLDLYHADLHSVSALQTAVIQGLDPEERYFRGYRIARERFERRRAEGLTGSALEVEREALGDLFLEEYDAFAGEQRPVLALDTLESLSYESDLIQNLCQLEHAPIATRDWLLERVGRLSNTVLLLAGRPQPALRRDLEYAYSAEPGRLEVIELDGLTREDSRQLLELLLRGAPPPAQALRDQADLLWQITAGQPVQLALTVELIAHSRHLNSAIAEGVSDLETWERRLVEALFCYDDPAGRTFFFLALARKGLTADLLHYLEAGWSEADCEHRLAGVCELSVVKTRPGGEEVFLHDALYELFDAHSSPDTELQPWYERLADYYRARQAEAGDDRAAWGQATVNLLCYELRRDPLEAFKTGYVRWDEVAIKGYEAGLDVQLREELLRFLRSPANEQRATAQGLTQAVVDRDGATRWIKRFLVQARYQQAIGVAETVLCLGPEPYPTVVPDAAARLATLPTPGQATGRAIFGSADPLFWGHVLTYYGEALTYVGAPEMQTRSVFDEGLTLLGSVSLEREAPLTWLRERVLGRAHNTLGYLLQGYGHYADALESFRRALLHFETAGVVDERADTLNNLAFLLALLGESTQARGLVNQALVLRQRLGQRYPLGLSHNTRGLIYTSQGQVEWGLRECQLALSIFEELDAPRGVGLACNALGFVLRKQGEAWKVGQCDLDQAMEFFRQAAGFLERATRVFSEKVSEPIRLWEAYNEQGSLYCDWAWLVRQGGNEAAAQDLYVEAAGHHLRALEIARRYGLRFQEADTCDDLAQLSADRGDLDQARQWLDQGVSLVPAEFILKPSSGFQDAPGPGEAHWLILGKAHLQQGIWVLRSDELDGPTDDQRVKCVREGSEHFALAAAYFQRYWPNTPVLSARLRSMARYLSKAGVSPDEVRALISQMASSHGVSLTSFLDAIHAGPADTSSYE